MNPTKKFILIGVALLWIIVIIWGVSQKLTPSQKEKLPTIISKVIDKGDSREKEISPETAPEITPAMIQSTEPPPILVRTFNPRFTDFTDRLSVMGSLKAKAEIPLRFEVQGLVQKILFKEGDRIKKGDLIANLDTKNAELKVKYAQSKLIAAEKTYNSLLKKLEVHKDLYAAEALIKAKLEEVEYEVESAEAQLEATEAEHKIAQEELKKSFIYAGKDGIMGKREAEEGEFVTPQNELGTFYDTSELFVEVGIVERDATKILSLQRSEIFVDAFPNKIFNGSVERLFPVVEGKSRTLTARIKIQEPDPMLLPGMFARVDVVTVDLKNALMVPTISLSSLDQDVFILPVITSSSIIEEEEGTKVGTVELRTVKVGYISSDYAQVLDSLKEGELLITEAQGDINEGSKVRIIGTEEFTQQ